MVPEPMVDGKGTHGGYCGSAVKPIALNMVAEIARTPETRDLHISGIGGITTWKDAVEFMALGSNAVQVCKAAMIYGFRVVDDLIDGMSQWMDDKGYTSVEQRYLAQRYYLNQFLDEKTNAQSQIYDAVNLRFDTHQPLPNNSWREVGVVEYRVAIV